MDKKLESYSKSEIIQAIRSIPKYLVYGHNIEKLIFDRLEEERRDKAFAEAQMARQTAIARMNEFFNWKKEMIEKYGDGKRVNLADLPRFQLERGANLQKAWNDSENARKAAEKEKKYESLVERYIRQRYSLNAELAILRQRYTKFQEFEEYNIYAEECKERAKAEVYGV